MDETTVGPSTAKTVLISSFLTLLIVFTILVAGREQIASYLFSGTALQQTTAAEKLEVGEPVVAAVEEINDAVVSVLVTKDVPVYEQYYETYNPFGLFGGFSIPRVRENGTEEREVGGGSGFIVSQDGMIVTNHHVVADDEARFSVLLNDGTVYLADVLASDAELDIAILKISEPLEKQLTVARFGDSNSLKLGQSVIAIGNALAEFQNSVSVGVISGLSRSIVALDSLGNAEYLDQVIQTDAAINPGNSGGPLLNLDGEVIGVNVATSRGADNIGFAIPAQIVKQSVDSVREYGEIVRPYLGVRYAMINSALASNLNLEVEYGALLVSGENNEVAVLPDSPAAKAGLVEGDVILEIDGELLDGVELAKVLRRKSVGQTIELKVLHDNEQKTVSVTLEKAI